MHFLVVLLLYGACRTVNIMELGKRLTITFVLIKLATLRFLNLRAIFDQNRKKKICLGPQLFKFSIFLRDFSYFGFWHP